MKKNSILKEWIAFLIIVCLLMWGALFTSQCHAAESGVRVSRVVVVVSKNIRPYVEALDGFRARFEALAHADVDVVMLDRFQGRSMEALADLVLEEGAPNLVAAIGPEAAAILWGPLADAPFPKIYAVILNPEKVIGEKTPALGISLNIAASEQMQMISRGFAGAKRIGLFYDPAYNTAFYESAREATVTLDVELVPLAVNSKKDIPFLLEECWDSIDCIWLIPDRTVISESITQYIIKQAVLNNVPVVGYNRFFYDSGAAMAFVFDYGDLGRQAADLAAKVLKNETPGGLSPVFKVWMNPSVLKKMGIQVPQPLNPPMMVGP